MKEKYYGWIIRGDLLGLQEELAHDPDEMELYRRYRSIFEEQAYIQYDVSPRLNGVLTAYQMYYRDVFYLGSEQFQAEQMLRRRLISLLDLSGVEPELWELEQEHLVKLFRSEGLHILGGKTGGYYGPYVWKCSETVPYEVELSGGVQAYAVRLLDGFLHRSWMDYLSFGELGAGGWTDGDGVSNCVKSAWDFESEGFRVSLLKHEAQHARDLELVPNMSSAELEYRAKLVELIYSCERNLLEQFAREADDSRPENGHAAAAARIVRSFSQYLGHEDFSRLNITEIQEISMELFRRDTDREI